MQSNGSHHAELSAACHNRGRKSISDTDEHKEQCHDLEQVLKAECLAHLRREVLNHLGAREDTETVLGTEPLAYMSRHERRICAATSCNVYPCDQGIVP